MQEKITIHQLVGKLVAEMKRAGFTGTTIWHCYMPRVGSIEHYYEKLGQVYYDPMVTDARCLKGMQKIIFFFSLLMVKCKMRSRRDEVRGQNICWRNHDDDYQGYPVYRGQRS